MPARDARTAVRTDRIKAGRKAVDGRSDMGSEHCTMQADYS